MGASGWSYFTPYQTDVEEALQTLRKEIFEKKAYGQTHSIQPEIFATMTPELKKAIKNLRQIESEKLGGEDRKFGSIEELLEASAESGTHSILDILQTSPVPDFAVAWQAPEDAIEELFGNAKPTREEIESQPGELTELLELERWQAVFLTVYKNGKPAEIYFEGVSGD
jgi:hypothetical protein